MSRIPLVRQCTLVSAAGPVMPGSIQMACARCAAIVWYDPQQVVPTGPQLAAELVLCGPCVTHLPGLSMPVMPHPSDLERVQVALGQLG